MGIRPLDVRLRFKYRSTEIKRGFMLSHNILKNMKELTTGVLLVNIILFYPWGTSSCVANAIIQTTSLYGSQSLRKDI